MEAGEYELPGIYGSWRVWTNAWDVFLRTPFRGGRGGRAPYFVVRFGCGGISFFFFERTHTACRKYEGALPHLPLY